MRGFILLQSLLIVAAKQRSIRGGDGDSKLVGGGSLSSDTVIDNDINIDYMDTDNIIEDTSRRRMSISDESSRVKSYIDAEINNNVIQKRTSVLVEGDKISSSADTKFDYDRDMEEDLEYIEDTSLARRTNTGGLISSNNDMEVAAYDNSAAHSMKDKFHREERVEVYSNRTSHRLFPFQTRIIGGKDAEEEGDSFTVALYDKDGNHFCGGCLIAKDAIITAAHCSDTVTRKGPISIGIGRMKLSDETAGEMIPVRREKLYPRYDPSQADTNWEWDACIMWMATPTMTKARTILPNTSPYFPRAGNVVTAYGWGDTDKSEVIEKSDMLQKASLRMISNEQCNESAGTYGAYQVSYKGRIQDNMLCANNRRRDSCQGDSGGPLVSNGVLVGIVSWGVGCRKKNFPGVYMRTSSIATWVNRNVCSFSMIVPPGMECNDQWRRLLEEEEKEASLLP